MKKRILTVLLAVCLVFALGTVSAMAEGEDTKLPDAKNNTITLTNDVVLSKPYDVEGNLTINLAGHSITASSSWGDDDYIIGVKRGATLTINDSSSGGSITNGNNDKIYAAVKVTLTGDNDETNAANLIVNGGTLEGYYYGIAGNGNRHNTVITINGGNITGKNGAGIYHPQYGEMTIEGGNITGLNTAVEIRSGELTISGGNFTSTASKYSETPNGNGTTVSGAAIAVSQHTTKKPISVSITGGTFTGPHAFSETKVQNQDSTKNVTIDIDGGTFKGEIASDDCTGFISGGWFFNQNGTTPNVNIDSEYFPTGSSVTIDEETGEVVNDTTTVATVDGVGYPSLQDAIDAADTGDKVELLKDVDLTAELSITKNITINGNGKKLTLTAAANSQGLSIGESGTASTVTLDDVKLTITGTQNTNADGIDVWGTLNLKNSTVSMSDLRSAFVMQGGLSAKLNINNSIVIVEDITGNGSNGGYVVIDDSNVTFDNVGSHALSVEEITVTNSSLSFTDVDYCALYGQEIVLDSGADVEIEDCGAELPHDGWGHVRYQAPVQVKVVDGDNDNGITVNSGASLTVTGTNDVIYIPEGTGFVSNGYVSADIDLGDTDMNVVTFVKNSTRQIKLVEDGAEIELPDPGKYLGREFVGWECSLNDRVYPEGYEYEVTRDVTFTAVWEAAAYDIVIDDDILHGDIWTSPKSEAEAGDTVYIYVDPDTGYVLDDIDVYYGYNYRNSVKVSYVRNNTYRFEMPNADVYITATFKANGMPFVDVHRTQWFYDSIYYVWSNDMMEGDSATTFNPDGTMTRAMFWAVLGRMDGQTITGTNWVEQARNWAMREGVSDGTNPNDYVTREQMVTMLWRYAGEKNGSANLNRYTDSGSVSGYAVEAMRWAIGNGVVQGVTSTTLAPKANATRAECATIFMRFDKM